LTHIVGNKKPPSKVRFLVDCWHIL
jgi:hypothetical protein